MKYFLDSVIKEDVDKWLPMIEGVTSNPILLKRAKMSNFDFLDIMKEYDIIRFVQITTFDEAIEILRKYSADTEKIIFKVTMHPKFYNVIERLKDQKLLVAATTIYDIIQINQAIEMGLDYTMVYKAKNEYASLFEDAYKLKTLKNSNINLVGASFRTKENVKDAILSGMDYSTVSGDVLAKTFTNHQLDSDIEILYDKK